MPDDTFELYDLRVEAVIPPGGAVYCGAKPGDHFELRGEMLHLPDGQGFSIYSLSAVLPLLAAKQRPAHSHDWMATDAEVACPDPNCSSRLRITRLGLRRFSHAAVTAVPLGTKESYPLPAPHPEPAATAAVSRDRGPAALCTTPILRQAQDEGGEGPRPGVPEDCAP